MHPSNIPSLFSSSLYNQSGAPTQTPSSSHSSSTNNPNHSADSEPSSAQSSASNSRANSPVSANHFGSNKSPFHQPSSPASAGSTTSSAAAAAQAAQAARMFQSISLNNNPSNSSMSVSPTQLTASASAARMKSEGEGENGDDVMEDANEGSNKRRLHLSPAAGFSTLKLKRKLRKNTREKQRRSEINERFDRLSDLLHLTNPSANSKVEKFTVLSEAFNTIENLRKECAMLKTEKSELKLEIHKLNNLIPHLTLLQPGAINSMSELEALRAINLNLSSSHNTTTPGMGVRMLGGVMSPLVSPRATMAIAHPGPHGPPGVVGANGTPTPVAMATVVSADPSGGGNGAFFSTSPPSTNRPLYSSGASSRPIAKPMTPAVTAVPTYRVTRANTLPSAAPPYGNLALNHAGHPPPALNLQAAAQSVSPNNNIMRANVVNANAANGNASMDTQNMNQNMGNSVNNNGVPIQQAPMGKLPAAPPLMSSTAQSAAAFSASSTSSMGTSSSQMPTLNPMVAVTSPPLVYNTLSSPPTSTSTLGVGLNMNLLHRPSVSDRVDFSQRRDSITSSMLVAERRRSLADRRSSFNYGNFGAMSSIGTLPSLTERRPSLPSLSSVFDRRGSITAGLMNASNTIQQALQEKDAQQNNPSSSSAATSSSSSGSAMSATNSLHPKVHHPHTRDGSTAPLNVLLGNLPQVDQIDALPSMPTLDHLHQNDQNDIFFGNMDDETLALNSFQ